MSERLQLLPGGPVSIPPDQVERFALALEAINESVYDWDVRTGAFEHLPLPDTSMRRWVDEPANADAWLATIHPEDRIAYATAVRAHLAGDTRRLACEYRYRANDGSWRWARQHGVVVRNEDGVATRLVGSVGDITPQKERERELETARAEAAAAHAEAQRTNELMNTVLDNMSDGVLLLDKDFSWLMANKRLTSFQAFPQGFAHIGMSGMDLLRYQAERGDFGPVEDIEAAVAERAALMRTPGGISYTRWMDGGYFVEFNFKPLPDGRLLAVYRDLTQLKASKDALQKAEGRLRDAIEFQPGGFALFDSERRLLLFNSAYADIFPSVPEWRTPGLTIPEILPALARANAVPSLVYGNIDAHIGFWSGFFDDPEQPAEFNLSDRSIHVQGRKTAEGNTVFLYSDVTRQKEAERRLRDAIEYQSGGFALYDSEMRLITCNSAFASLIPGMPQWRQPGVPFRELMQAVASSGVVPDLAPDKANDYVEFWVNYAANPNRPVELNLGNNRWIQIEGRRTAEGNTVVLFADLSRLKERERELAQTQERLAEAIENQSGGFALYGPDLRLITCNAAFAQIQPHVPEWRTPGVPLTDVLEAVARNNSFPGTEAMAPQEYAAYWHAYMRNPDRPIQLYVGDNRWLQLEARRTPNGNTVVLFNDLSKLKQRERELATAQERLTAAIENLVDGFAYFDADERLVICNEAYRAFMQYAPKAIAPGYTIEEGLRNRFTTEPLPIFPMPVEEYLQAFLRVHRGGNANVEVPTAAGRFVRIRNQRTPDGGVVVVVADISELKLRAAELEKARDVAERGRVEAQAANQAKSTFLATMSHEIRTPMNGVLGMMDVLEHQGLNDMQRRTVGTMRDSAHALLRIIDDVLDFSKIEAGRLELEETAFSLSGLIESVVATFAGQARGKGLKLVSEIRPDSHDALVGDPTRVRQILFNLLGNALKFTERGSVRVEAGTSPLGDGRARVVLTVRDTGIGLDEEERGRLFRPFAQADSSTTRRFGGSGLGLSIVRRLAQLMGGDVAVDSAPGAGSAFEVSLELAVAPADSPLRTMLRHMPVKIEASQSSGSMPVLVVDDHPVNRDVLVMQLNLLGIPCDTANDGLEGLRLWEPGRYAVVLADIHMPHMDGYELARQIRAQERAGTRTPIVAVTANALKGEEVRCHEAGMDGYLAKPVTIDRLRTTLERWLSVETPSTSAKNGDNAVASDAIDRDVLIAWLGDDSEAIDGLLRKFRKTAIEAEREIEAAFRAGNLAVVAAAAHKLKGAAHTIGAARLGTAAGVLEQGGRTGDRIRCRDGLGALATEIRGVLAELPAD